MEKSRLKAPPEDPVYNLMLLGDGGVGKSALTFRICHDKFVEDYDPTIEESFRKVTVVGGEQCVLDILDTSGQHEYLALRESKMRGRDGFIMVLAVNNRRSLQELSLHCEQVLRVHDGQLPPMISWWPHHAALLPIGFFLACNKIDLPGRVIALSDVQQWAQQWNAPVVETSAKDNTGVDTLFSSLVGLIRKSQKSERYPGESGPLQSLLKRYCCCCCNCE